MQTAVLGSSSDSSGTCRPAQLHALFRGFQGGGSLAGAVVVVDAGHSPCELNGAPRSVTLLDDGGATVTVHQHALDLPPNAGPVQLLPQAALPSFGAPPAPGSAWFSLAWSNWCSDATPSVDSILVVLPAGGSIAAPLDDSAPAWAAGPPAPRCADARSPSSLSFGRFQASPS